MAHAQKIDFVFRWNGRVHLNRRGRNSVDCWQPRCAHQRYTAFRGSVRVLANHSIRQFPLQFPSLASPCAIRFQTYSKKVSKFLNDVFVTGDYATGWSNEVIGNEHKGVEYASSTVDIKVRCFHSCDPVGCRLCEYFLLCFSFWLCIRTAENMSLGMSVLHEIVWVS
jgi:hypothetical protein